MNNILTAAEIEALVAQHLFVDNGTHSDTCWQWHMGCAFRSLAASHLALLREYNKALYARAFTEKSAGEVMLDE